MFETNFTAIDWLIVVVYLGAPYDSEASLEDTRALLRRIKPDTVSVRPYYPWPGTRATETCRENGWPHSRGEEQYHQDRTGIDMPAAEDLPSFVDNLENGLASTLAQPALGDPAQTMPEALSPFTWGVVFQRVESVWRGLVAR